MNKETKMNGLTTYEIIKLERAYPSIYGSPIIDRFENSIFTIKSNNNCLTNNFCNDGCCRYGTDIDIDNVNRLSGYVRQIENEIQFSSHEWFLGNYTASHEYPGNQYTRTNVKDGSCIFHNNNGRGCLIHKFCIENSIDFHILKPMVCSLFPITFDDGLLHPSDEVIQTSLICLNDGLPLYQNSRNELIYHFGMGLVNELDIYEKENILCGV